MKYDPELIRAIDMLDNHQAFRVLLQWFLAEKKKNAEELLDLKGDLLLNAQGEGRFIRKFLLLVDERSREKSKEYQEREATVGKGKFI